jgi:hypothetical protein
MQAMYPVVIVLLVSLERMHLEVTVSGSLTEPIHFGGSEGAATTPADRMTNATSIRLHVADTEDTRSNHDSSSDITPMKEKGT